MILKLLLHICFCMTQLQGNELLVKSMDEPTSHQMRQREGMKMLDPVWLAHQKPRQASVQQAYTSTTTRTEE